MGLLASYYSYANKNRFIDGVSAYLDPGVSIRDVSQANQMRKTNDENRIRLDLLDLNQPKFCLVLVSVKELI